jgi:diguanylate cyclase (GGDEF)-like protein
MSAAPRGVFETLDVFGEPRLFAHESISENPDGRVPLRIVLGIPQRVIYAEAHKAFVENSSALLIVTLLLLLGGWVGAEVMVLRNLRKLIDVASRLRGGDLTARTGLRAADEEISQVGRALDEMAQALQDRDAKLQQALLESRQLATTDPLTGLHNRRSLWELLGRELSKAEREGTPVAALLADIDHFKRINDQWGHGAGDRVLQEVARVVREHTREYDIACRYGGEELAIVLPGADLRVALERAETIRAAIAALRIDYDGAQLPAVTASFGAAVYRQHAEQPDDLLRRADVALYEAKSAGRNRVVGAS